MVICIAFICSCSSSEDPNSKLKVVAEFDNEFLYEKDLASVFGQDWKKQSGPVRNYIRLWLKNQIVSKTAKEKLNEQEKDFEKQLKDYENSLLRYAYEKKLIDSLLVTEVSDSAIMDYYSENKKNFELKENIVKVRYVKVPKNHKSLNKLKYLIQYKDSTGRSKFFKKIKESLLFCEINDSNWVELEELKNLIPIKLYNDEHFLRHYKYTEAPDGDAVWIVYFSEHRLKDGIAPIKMVEDHIKTTILNKRKQQIIIKHEEDLLNQAKQNNLYKTYVQF